MAVFFRPDGRVRGGRQRHHGANYLIEAVGPVDGGRYAWAVVSGNDDQTGWILARKPELDKQQRDAAEAAARDAGFDPDAMKQTQQPPDSYNPS